jgi:hypothetical protein
MDDLSKALGEVGRVSVRERLRSRLHRWVDGSWGLGGGGIGPAGPGLTGSFDAPAIVKEMAEDVVAESDKREQDREERDELRSGQ